MEHLIDGINPGCASLPREAPARLGELDAARGELAELTDVLRGRVTLGATAVLGPIPTGLASRYSAQPLVDETLLVITPPGHALGGASRLTLRQLREDPIVCLTANSGLRAILDAAAAAEGVALNPEPTSSPAERLSGRLSDAQSGEWFNPDEPCRRATDVRRPRSARAGESG